MHSKLKWLILIQVLLNEQALCRVPPPLALRNTPLPGATVQEEGGTAKEGQQPLLGSRPHLGLPSVEQAGHTATGIQKEDRVRSAERMINILGAKLKRQMQDHIHIQGNVSCEELLSASTMDDPSSSMFPQELLGLSLVPVLVVAGCPKEAQTLVLKLYDLLGVADVEELLMEVGGLIERRMTQPASTPAPASAASSSEKAQAERHIEAVMFNIQQLAMVGEGGMGPGASEQGTQGEVCEGWTRVNGTMLLGKAVEGVGGLEEAVRACESLGVQCAGVARGGLLKPGKYQAVLKKGSRVLPSESSESECWIRQCNVEEDVSLPTAAGRRMKRSPQRNCINKREERVYNVVEWIPAVSTLYNLGTAVYYASVNCSETAKERAILSAVDLGTDALMAVTGGTAGVAGYALGAGVKTGVKAGIKYLLSSMKQDDDLMVNQYSWEQGIITIH
ncbi:uncharacterized protein apof [Centroberyx affinis]|uniref:uncharacterized protein apof n=1 Tax=Centroberyx affinis TaxID=166261 RepID=UPI003A5C5EC5